MRSSSLILWFQARNTSGGDRAGALDDCYSALERDLVLLGATAIEDNLQRAVPETIDALRQAGIKVWMLTGDKHATAIQIARSCKLFQNERVLEIREDDVEKSLSEIETYVNVKMPEGLDAPEVSDVCVCVCVCVCFI